MQRLIKILLVALLFFLPWQTRLIWHYGQLSGGFWEYGSYSIFATEILLWLILVLFFIQNFLKKEFWTGIRSKKSISAGLFILFIIFFGISTAFSKDFWISYNFVFKLLEAMALMVVLAWQNEKLKFQFALWAGGVIQGGLAIWQFFSQKVVAFKWLGLAEHKGEQLGASVVEFGDERWLRAYGAFGSPNTLGIFLAVIFVLGTILYLKIENKKYKIALLAGNIFVVIGLILSFSRGAWLAASIGMISLIIIHAREKEVLRKVLKQSVYYAFVGLALVIILFPLFTARFNTQNRLEKISVMERVAQTQVWMDVFEKNFIFGLGPGTYTLELSEHYPNIPAWRYQPMHNIYMLAAVEIGIFAFIFLALIVYKLAKLIYIHNRAFFSLIIVVLVAGLFDHPLWSLYTGIMIWWITCGLSLAMVDLRETGESGKLNNNII
ncbi:MAG: O-antigen ligase family protein [Patescibacteria group bacterium]